MGVDGVERGPASRGVGEHERDVVGAQDVGHPRIGEGGRARFERVAQRPVVLDVEPRSSIEADVVVAGERQCRTRGAGERGEEVIEDAGVELDPLR